MGFRVAKGICVKFKSRGSDGEAIVNEGERVGDCTWRPLRFV